MVTRKPSSARDKAAEKPELPTPRKTSSLILHGREPVWEISVGVDADSPVKGGTALPSIHKIGNHRNNPNGYNYG